jgi:subtilase family serine protease
MNQPLSLGLIVTIFTSLLLLLLQGCSVVVVDAASTESKFVIPSDYSTFTKINAVDPDTDIDIVFALSLQNEDELDEFIEDIYNPSSVNYRGYLSSSEFCEKYCPSDADVAQVKSYLEQNNFEVIEITVNNRLIQAHGTAGAVNAAFGVNLNNYVDSKGVQFYAPGSEPKLPDSLNVQAILGLENRAVMFHQSIPSKTKKKPITPYSGLTPANISSSYNLTTVKEKGEGQVLGLVEFSLYLASDLQGYQDIFFGNSYPLNVENIPILNPNNKHPTAEVVLDIELMHAVAPAAKILVYEAPNTNAAGLLMLNKIATDNLASVISDSWVIVKIK